MSIVVDKVAEEVVTKWKKTTRVVCDQCGAEQDLTTNPNAANHWFIVKRQGSSHWADFEEPYYDKKHFDTFACLRAWVNGRTEASKGWPYVPPASIDSDASQHVD